MHTLKFHFTFGMSRWQATILCSGECPDGGFARPDLDTPKHSCWLHMPFDVHYCADAAQRSPVQVANDDCHIETNLVALAVSTCSFGTMPDLQVSLMSVCSALLAAAIMFPACLWYPPLVRKGPDRGQDGKDRPPASFVFSVELCFTCCNGSADGSYEVCNDPYFSSNRLSLVDRGFVFAIAHARGGGEMGRQWYETGKYLHKKNTFVDFVACAEHLVAKKYTSPSKLCMEVSSANMRKSPVGHPTMQQYGSSRLPCPAGPWFPDKISFK